MRKTVIITEKPKVAGRIAKVLGGSAASEERLGKVRMYRIKKEKEEIVVVPASGHVFELDYPDRRWVYPAVVDPSKLIYKPIQSKRDYVRAIKREVESSDRIVVATDLDTEGSSIGLEILQALGAHDREVRRMMFSALTDKDIKEAYENLAEMDLSRAYAGFVRRVLDLEWGANVTRALTLSTRNHRWVKLLSSGRVQGPTLKMIVDREKEIRRFKPEKYYVVTGIFRRENGDLLEAALVPPRGEKRIKNPETVEEVRKLVGMSGEAKVKVRRVSVPPPPPFDGTTLQVEVSSITGLSPREISDRSRGIAQQLYESGIISYIGTESQKYPKKWGRREFISMLKTIASYTPLSSLANWTSANMRNRPVEGDKIDPAHPCIHVVGAPKSERDLPTEKHRKVYEIIARRVMATLSPDGVDERRSVEIKISGHRFVARGSTIVEMGWREVYPFARSKEVEIPTISDGEVLKLVDVRVEEKETKPPKRYTPRTIIKAMEKLGLGTKNTRAVILDILKERDYVEGNSFRPTKVGEKIVDVLEKNIPEIVDLELTSKLDRSMRLIEEGKLEHKRFLEESLQKLSVIMEKFEKIEDSVGRQIAIALEERARERSIVGKCPKCGGDLLLRRSKYGYFVVCSDECCGNKYHLFRGERVLQERCSCSLPLVRGRVRLKSGRRKSYIRCLGNCERSPLRCAKCRSVAIPRFGSYGVYIRCDSCGSSNYFKVRR